MKKPSWPTDEATARKSSCMSIAGQLKIPVANDGMGAIAMNILRLISLFVPVVFSWAAGEPTHLHPARCEYMAGYGWGAY